MREKADEVRKAVDDVLRERIALAQMRADHNRQQAARFICLCVLIGALVCTVLGWALRAS